MIKTSLLFNLPVYTAAGFYVGRVVNIEVDLLSQQIICYHLKPKFKLVNLWQKKILISPRQVIKITNNAMVIEDNWSKIVAAPIGLVSELS
ncbi:MAG: PRC-barrel domain-containing protein [Patescibacteria group bacterium]